MDLSYHNPRPAMGPAASVAVHGVLDKLVKPDPAVSGHIDGDDVDARSSAAEAAFP
jgi:hypothetical protein